MNAKNAHIAHHGIFNIPLREYINDPAPVPSLNSGTAHRLLTASPLHAWTDHPRLNDKYVSEQLSRLELGTIVHALLLEKDRSRVVLVEAEDWRTKAAKEKRDEARALGKLPILSKDMAEAESMVSVATKAIGASEIAGDFATAIPEQTLIWEDEGIWCRSRPDKATKDWKVLFDYKTVAGSANPKTFMRAILQHGYDLQAVLGLRGVERLRLADKSTFIFIAQEIDPPYAVSFVSLNPEWVKFADDKLRMAMSIWKGCLRTNEWPAYSNRIAYLEPPPYAVIGWDENLPEIDAEDFI